MPQPFRSAFGACGCRQVGQEIEQKSLDLQSGARRAGEMRTLTKRLGLSLADRACLALAERENLPVFTADKNWSKAGLVLDIRIIR